MDKKEIGKKGEERALGFLKQKGYKILEQNYHKRSGEIDIIAFDPHYGEYVFVEVKTRKNNDYGYPEEFVDWKKIEKITATGEIWLAEKQIQNPEWRIDCIGIVGDQIDYLENIS